MRKKSVEKSTRDAYGEALLRLGESDSRIVALDADLPSSTRTGIFAEKFPDRFFNLGVAEQNLYAVAAGLATCGKIPFASTFAVFATERALNQIKQCIAYPALNVNIVATHSGFTPSGDGASHQALIDIAFMRCLPNMTVIAPADATRTEKAIRAAEIVEKKGIDVELINVHTVKPIDREMLVGSAIKTRCVLTVEDHSIVGGLASAAAEVYARHHPVPITMVGVEDVFGESGEIEQLYEKHGLTATQIADKIRVAVQRK